MKKIIFLVLLLAVAGVAGIVRSHTKATGTGWRLSLNKKNHTAEKVRDEIRKSFELAPGARVEVSGINGWVKIETANTRTADILIERTGDSQEVLNRRKVTVENNSEGLKIKGDKDDDANFLSRVFGSKPNENVTLRLPREISLVASGVNGSVTSGAIDGSVEVSGVNGKVELAQAIGSAEFSGINGNVSIGIKQLSKDVDISGINGNIELRLSAGTNADLNAHGMNGTVSSDLPNVVVDKRHGSYSARVGNGGNSISASGINGNIRLTGMGGERPGD